MMDLLHDRDRRLTLRAVTIALDVPTPGPMREPVIGVHGSEAA